MPFINRQKREQGIEMKTITLTGHRPKHLIPQGDTWGLTHPLVKGYGSEIRKELLKQAGFNSQTQTWESPEPITLISGMALGVDTIGAMVLLRLKAQFPNRFFLECAIPCLNQDDRWKADDKKRYKDLLSQADVVTYVSEKAYTNGCMQKRNEYMVNQADVILAVWDGSKSGTGNCVIYALEQGMPVMLIEPISLRKGVL